MPIHTPNVYPTRFFYPLVDVVLADGLACYALCKESSITVNDDQQSCEQTRFGKQHGKNGFRLSET